MAPSFLLRQRKLEFLAAVVILFLSLNSNLTAGGVKKELWLYTVDGGSLYFETHFPDLTEFEELLSKVYRSCTIGLWATYTKDNYRVLHYLMGLPDNTQYCQNITFASSLKSLRYLASNDTSNDAISLYDGRDFSYEEILVTEQARTNISTSIDSVAATGSGDWMLFEGPNLDGKSMCYQVPYVSYYYFSWNRLDDAIITLQKIASVFKGCDEREIQLYRDSYLI